MELFGGDGKKYSTEKENSTGRCHLFCVSNNTGTFLDEYSVDFLLCGWKYVRNLHVDNE